ncbi:MAG: DUF4145 domain-containing protein [Sterolibacterium sp.]|jgi:hypothetical protein
MLVKLNNASSGGGLAVSVRCPGCGNVGTFIPALQNVGDIHVPPNIFLGQRRCPNPLCQVHVFCIYDNKGEVQRTYPPERIDFDPKGIPAPIVETFTEALTCRAEGLHVAAAIMIRRTLEELCEEKSATGNTLKDRISSLQSSVVLPKELFIALDDLRLLGNDAAHIEAKTYNSIGPAEVDIGIELTKEVLKAVYQLDDLLARLRALKKP